MSKIYPVARNKGKGKREKKKDGSLTASTRATGLEPIHQLQTARIVKEPGDAELGVGGPGLVQLDEQLPGVGALRQAMVDQASGLIDQRPVVGPVW